jgi:hypothetical protein
MPPNICMDGRMALGWAGADRYVCPLCMSTLDSWLHQIDDLVTVSQFYLFIDRYRPERSLL